MTHHDTDDGDVNKFDQFDNQHFLINFIKLSLCKHFSYFLYL